MEIIDHVKSALRKLDFGDDEIHLEQTSSGKVGGHLLSSSFDGKSQLDRQNELWTGLRQNLDPPELARIVAILTVTPEEIGSDD